MRKTLLKLHLKLRRLMRCESGQDMVEYGLLVTLIALLSISGASGVANSVNQIFGQVSRALINTQQPPPPPPPPPPRHHDHHHGGFH